MNNLNQIDNRSKHKDLSDKMARMAALCLGVVATSLFWSAETPAKERLVTQRVTKSGLAETEKLMRNDNLEPTQNRTQAMRLEAETGGINPREDAVLKPKPQPGRHPVKRASASRARPKRRNRQSDSASPVPTVSVDGQPLQLQRVDNHSSSNR